MSFAEKDYTHGIDLITIKHGEEEEGKETGKSKEWKVDFLEYKPQHALRILPENEEELTFKKWQKVINSELSERTDGELSDHFDYVMLNNFYEYEIPLKLTAAGRYDTYSAEQCRAVWPEENMLDIDLSVFTKVKQARNREKSLGNTNLTTLFSVYDDNRPNNKVSVMGNPTLGEVKTIMIGVRNNARATKSVEVWANELRLQEYSNDGGWAARVP